jgi:hypothetical protein
VIERRASLVVLKVMKQALANALNNHGLKFADLQIKSITVGEGPRYKRFQAVSRGRAHSIVKTTSHVQVQLMTKEEAVKETKAEKAPVAAQTEAVKSAETKEVKPKITKKVTKTSKKK